MGLTHAGTLTSGLADAYSQAGETELLPVLIVLNDSASASQMADEFAAEGLPLAQIHQRVMDALKSQADSRQAAVLRQIESLQALGDTRVIRPLWIANVISIELNRSAAEAIAELNDVEEIGLDEIVTLQRSQPILSDGGSASLRAIGALDVWLKGTRGQGRIVCVIGDGQAVNHPALANNWRGKSAPLNECWYDKSGGSPASCGNESNYLLGLLCGAPAGNFPATGVAPAAHWIAANVFCAGITRFSDLLAAYQWAADPDGNSATMNDVPDAICSPWESNAGCLGSEPSGVWRFVSNLESMGSLPVFAFASAHAPASFPACFTVGNLDVRGGTPALDPSSPQGPSPCDPRIIKPDLTSPGTAVHTTGETSYVDITGAPAAAAYVTGAVALIRQTNPQLSAQAIKTLLLSSAKDLGDAGTDNRFGSGLLDISKAAAMAVSSENTGSVQVAVRSEGKPLSGARVVLMGSEGIFTANTENGEALFNRIPAGDNYSITVGRFGCTVYVPDTPVSVNKGETARVTAELQSAFEDNAEYDQGWSLGISSDDATSGQWIRAIPVASKVTGKPVQPDLDADPDGKYCFVTGNADSRDAEASQADVDGGRTTLQSPMFDLRDMESPELSFSYWYSNDKGTNPGSDVFRAQISSDGGATWTDLLNTTQSTTGWTAVKYSLNNFVTAARRIQLQFIAEDLEPGSLVEAAVDAIRTVGTPSAPEAPQDLTLDVQFNQVFLRWHSSKGARAYRVYLAGNADKVVDPANLYSTVSDTTLIVPMADIPYVQFYFQVTAVR